jgi:hypothetical protein
MSMKTPSLDRRFSFARVALLTRNRLLDEASVAGIGAALIFALNLLGLLVARRAFFNAAAFGEGLWIPTIFVAGILLAAQAFRGMHDGKGGTDWMLLPATPLEKYAAAFLDSVVLFPLAAATAGALMSALLALLERAVGGSGGPVWTPFRIEALRAWADYAAAAVVLLAGSAAFRKAALIKTLGLGVAYSLVVGLILAGGLWAFFGGGSGDIPLFARPGLWMGASGSGMKVSAAALRAVRVDADVARYAILPAFAILFGAAKVAEKESRDEVQ